MQFSIITPSFRASAWLKLCIESVADQGVDLEHIIQDAVSDDGTMDWLPQEKRVKAYFEKDRGMYDAVNRGLRKAKGDILAYINCDEQYLPGALKAVEKCFAENPNAEMVLADSLVINEDGSLNCFRKVHIPWESHTRLDSLCALTCSIFFRRSLIDDRKLFFSDRLRDLGDGDWMVRALRAGVRMKVLRYYTAAFTETGANMNLKPNAIREKAEFRAAAPLWMRLGKPLLSRAYHVKRLFEGGYFEKPLTYEIYTKQSPAKRVRFEAPKPSPFWKRVPLKAEHTGAEVRAAG
ncbi:MAG TPA: glycosyltransferase [Verrucomicrobiae bacterium]